MGKKKLRFLVGIPLLTGVLLAAGLAVPALAAPHKTTPSKQVLSEKIVEGKVVSVSPGTLTFVVSRGADNVTVSTNATTKFYLLQPGKLQGQAEKAVHKLQEELKKMEKPHGKGPKADIDEDRATNLEWFDKSLTTGQFSDVVAGDRVIARVRSSNNMASQVLIIKAPPIKQVKGTITATTTNPNTVVINTSTGAVTIKWDAETRFNLKGLISVQPGQYAIATYNSLTGLAKVVNVLPSAPSD